MSEGNAGFISSSRALTVLATSSALAPVCRKIAMPTEGLPSTVGAVS